MEDTETNEYQTSAKAAQFPRRFRLYQKRTKTGCLVCRGRRKKCDEVKPTCLACWRTGSQCTWPKAVSLESSTPESAASDAPPCHNPSKAHSKACQTRTCIRTVALQAHSSVWPDAASPEHNDQARKNGSRLLVSPRSLCLPDFAGSQRALYLTPCSCTLFSHYLAQTGALIAPKPLESNAFLTFLVPVAIMDDLLMHAVLALSAAHLDFQGKAQPNIQLAASAHYGRILHGLRQELTTLSELSTEKMLRLSLVLVLLCHIEAVSGNVHGSIFPHLRAWRQIILHLLNQTSSRCPDEFRDLQGFVIEVYSYLTLVSNITPYGLVGNRTLPLDPFLTSLGQLKKYESFGTFLGCGSSLFELIPPISMLAAKRLQEEAANICSDESLETFERLLSFLDSWEPAAVAEDMAPWRLAYIAIGEVYRHALCIYLKTAMCGSVVSNPKTICQIQQHIDAVFAQSKEVFESPYGTIMPWPAVITGSCVTKDDQRQVLRDRFSSPGRWRFTQVTVMQGLLELLWSSDDKHAYGPYGLFLTMKKHNIDFCMA